MNPQSNEPVYIELAVDYPTAKDKTYTYRAPANLIEDVVPGAAFLVEFNRRPAIAFFIGTTKKPPEIKISEVQGIVDSFSIPRDLVEVAKQVSKLFGSPIAELLKLCSPPGESSKIKKTVTINENHDAGNLTSDEITALESLRSSNNNDKTSMGQLKMLQSKGLIKVTHYLDYQQPKEKTIALYTLTDRQETKGLTPKQVEIIDFLGKRKRADGVTLKEAGFSSNIINRLVGKGIVNVEKLEMRQYEKLNNPEFHGETILRKLTAEQEASLKEITSNIAKEHKKFYLWGITGSGKTEIYKRAALEAVNNGRTALILVPEISLTPQLRLQFAEMFGGDLSILHSGLPKQERLSNWMKIYAGDAKVVLGTRLAVFSPLRNIGLIVLDEEHENSYKQNNPPRYDARKVAAIRAEISQAVLLNGSATPSIENFYHIKERKVQLLRLDKRINGKNLPEIALIDMREEQEKGLFSHRLTQTINSNIADNKKVMLFLNRRGFSRYLSCYDCSFIALCPNCSISLTYHNNDQLLCHYCSYESKALEQCPKCGGRKIVYRGTGTQRIEEELHAKFPQARVFRMDSDTTSKQGSHEDILNKFQKADKAILLGTQMIAKGLHFPEVSLVGVINADTVLNMPDFRAAERTFQLLIQMSGRSGRGREQGTVIVQTYNPEHYAIKYFASSNMEGFYNEELKIREEAKYPPFVKLINIVFSSTVPLAAKEIAESYREGLKELKDIYALGPAPAPIHKLNGKYRWHILLKAGEAEMEELVNKLHSLMLKLANKSVKILIDVDPNWLL